MRNASLARLGILSMLTAAALLSACAVPEARLRTGLIDAGVPKPLAGCMAERMVDRLSLMQLRRMGDLPRADDSRTLQQFLHRVRALGDPEIWTVTSSAAAACAFS